MAIYHFSAKVITRTTGRSALGAAAYRSGQALQQEGIAGVLHDYTRKEGVAHREILAPVSAPEWMRDRSMLWNEVDRLERRKDAQLARELEVALPVELSKIEQVDLVRAFARTELVARGMVVDFAIHHDNPQNPHAHIMVSLREVGSEGFGDKDRSWNEKSLLRHWREAWASITNEHLAMAGHEARIDHRSHFELGISLEPGRKIGIGLDRQAGEDLPRYLAERVAEQQRIARENGERLLANPNLALEVLTHQQATFTERDVARFLHTRTYGVEQFQNALLKITTSPDVVPLVMEQDVHPRYTTREMLQMESKLFDHVDVLAARSGHHVNEFKQEAALQGSQLSLEQRKAFTHVVQEGDVVAVMGVAGSGKSTFLAAAREAWETAGYSVKGATLSGIAGDNLQRAAGITSRTIASYELAWRNGRDPLTSNDVLVIDEAAMIGTRQLARVIEAAERAKAKVVLVGDPEQLQAIEAGAPFRKILSQVGVVELTEVRRQAQLWQREATRQFAKGNTAEALEQYHAHNQVHGHRTMDDAQTALLSAWSSSREHAPHETQLMTAYKRDDVTALNDAARAIRKAKGEISSGEVLTTARGQREFSAGDRLYFLRNERSLGVKNGSLATVESVRDGVLQVTLDGQLSRSVTVDTRLYQHIDHGYAATIHKSQGSTVDRSFVLASRHFDRHATYVALSRHRVSAEVHYSYESFAGRDSLHAALSRARHKDMATDYEVISSDNVGSQPANDVGVDRGALTRFQHRLHIALSARSDHPKTNHRDVLTLAREEIKKPPNRVHGTTTLASSIAREYPIPPLNRKEPDHGLDR